MNNKNIRHLASNQRGTMKEHVKVVVHFIDDIVTKGYVNDFNANRSSFHLYEGTNGSLLNPPILLEMKEIKAVFFVKTFEGNKGYFERNEFMESDRNLGRRVEVTFIDGEVIRGYTVDYAPLLRGFYLIPADPDSNNIQIFVVSNAVMRICFI